MSRRHTRLRFSLCAAALLVALGWPQGPACAAVSAAPPAAPVQGNAKRGLNLTLPAMPSGEARARGGKARPGVPDDREADDRPTLRAHLEINPNATRFAAIAGIVYAF
jgi:hypothetical protein